MKNIKKLLSLLLCGIMLFGMFPASLFAAGGDTGDGSGTISETVVPKITWKRTFEYEHRHDTAANQHTDLGGLYAGDKTAYLSTESETENSVTTYKNKVHWDWAAFSEHFNGRTDDVDDSEHKVWDYGHTDVQYADPVKDSITNPINSTKTIGSVGIIPYAPSAGQQAIFAATWNNRAAQDFEASSVDGTDIYYGSYVSVKQGQMDIGYGKKSSDSTISTFSGKSFTARRFSGSFVWPEGYTLSDSIELISKNDSYYKEIYDAIENDPDLKAAFGGKKVVAINDDMFVFVYKDGEQLTEDNYRDYLAFFAGTAGKGVWSWPDASPQDTNHGGSGVGWGGEWNVTEPATYGDKYAAKAFNRILPNLDTAGADRSTSRLSASLSGTDKTDSAEATAGMMALSDYWYSFMDGNAISTVLNNKYGTTGGINAGDTVHIDIYCIDMDKAGGMDELEIRLTRQKPTTSTVKVRYWLNEVGEITDTTKYLGQSVMTGQTIGSQITLVDGTAVNQLDYLRAAAITANKNKDVNTGVQIEKPFTVTEKSEDNIINVVYVPAANKVVHLWAGSLEVPYDGREHVVHDVKITQDGYNDITVPDSETTTSYQLADGTGNKVTKITAQRKEIYPGIYVVDFARTSKVESYWGGQLNNYSIIYHPGTLKITYAPPAKTFVYDFGVQNSYKLTDVEEKAVGIKTVDENVKHVGFNDTDKSILYTPQSVNKGETIQTKLVFTGNYITEATSITFLPATNVLYEENFMNISGTNDEWRDEGKNNTATVVNDNENSVYGYADAYKDFADYSNGGALKATLNLNGGKRAYTTDAVEFSFNGTGFDIISECGTNTGLIIAAVSKDGNPFKVYIVDTYFCGDNGIAGDPPIPPIPPIITDGSILDYQVPVVRAMNLERADYSVRILGYLTDTAGAIIGPANPTPWDGGETGAEGSTRGANGIDTNRILREAGLKEFIGCEVETSFMDENSVLNGGTGIAAKNSQNRTFGKRDTAAAQTANVYLDAFRVYKPLADETKYIKNEQGLAYAPVYDYVKNSANSIGSEILPNSMVYVEYDGDTGIANIAKYQDRGPQNEVYLTNGNYIGFALEGYTEGKTVMISAKAVAGDPVLGYLDTDTNVEGAVIPSGMKMTEMYYDVTACVRRYGAKYMLVLGNIAEAGTGTGTRSILSVSGIKLAKDITPATSTQIAADIASLVTLAYQPVEEPVFTPERFELRYSGRALAGWFTRISVKTSTDVDHVSVYRLADDGSLVPVRENMRPMNSLFTYFGWMDYYAFSLTVRAPRRGMTDTYYIFAYDANGVASEPAIASITGR